MSTEDSKAPMGNISSRCYTLQKRNVVELYLNISTNVFEDIFSETFSRINPIIEYRNYLVFTSMLKKKY